MRIAHLIGFAAALLACAPPVLAQEIPLGYRLPTQEELADKDRAESPTRFARAVADFNGDGVEDEAVLLQIREQWIILLLGRQNQEVPSRMGQRMTANHPVNTDAVQAARRLDCA